MGGGGVRVAAMVIQASEDIRQCREWGCVWGGHMAWNVLLGQ